MLRKRIFLNFGWSLGSSDRRCCVKIIFIGLKSSDERVYIKLSFVFNPNPLIVWLKNSQTQNINIKQIPVCRQCSPELALVSTIQAYENIATPLCHHSRLAGRRVTGFFRSKSLNNFNFLVLCHIRGDENSLSK